MGRDFNMVIYSYHVEKKIKEKSPTVSLLVIFFSHTLDPFEFKV